MEQRSNFCHSFLHLISIYYARNCSGAKRYGDEQDLFLFFEELRALHIGRTYEHRMYDTKVERKGIGQIRKENT